MSAPPASDSPARHEAGDAQTVPWPRLPRAQVRMLHLEDSEPDHALVMAQLRRSGLAVSVLRVETRADFTLALGERWDVILSDYHLPGFTGVQALRLLQQDMAGGGRAVPFILVSGQIGEDTAVEAMRSGAADYLLKNNLSRLAPAIEHAIEAADVLRARAAADAELQASRARLSALAQHLQTSVEAERHAIAREIHDEVGGSLTALKFDLDWIRRHAQDAQLQSRAASALDTVSSALQVSQRIMQNLRPAILDQGLVAALQWLCGSFEKRTGVACSFCTGRELPVLPSGVPLVVYRTAQEALTNIGKHAAASRVQLDLSLSEGVLSLEVSDNGRGMSDADLAKARSFGIRGLHERASHVGGWVDLSSSAAGTSLIVSVPLATVGGGKQADPADAKSDAGTDPSTDPSANPSADPNTDPSADPNTDPSTDGRADPRADAAPPAGQNVDPPEPGTS